MSEHSPGHGDLPEALQKSGLLDRFAGEGGRYLTSANLDNLGATLDPIVIGSHALSGRPVTIEVVDKVGTDKGGIPARLDDRRVILEEFRIPPSFDASQVPVFNTNTFHIDVSALRDLSMPWTYFVVEKGLLLTTDLHLPLGTVGDTDADGIHLTLTDAELEAGDWALPPAPDVPVGRERSSDAPAGGSGTVTCCPSGSRRMWIWSLRPR